MLIYVFPPHYQSVHFNIDISSFSVISYAMNHGGLHTFHGAITGQDTWKRRSITFVNYMNYRRFKRRYNAIDET